VPFPFAPSIRSLSPSIRTLKYLLTKSYKSVILGSAEKESWLCVSHRAIPDPDRLALLRLFPIHALPQLLCFQSLTHSYFWPPLQLTHSPRLAHSCENNGGYTLCPTKRNSPQLTPIWSAALPRRFYDRPQKATSPFVANLNIRSRALPLPASKCAYTWGVRFRLGSDQGIPEGSS
jgi:hypothetical protein